MDLARENRKSDDREKRYKHREQAAFYINLLDMLQEKTKGNLTDYEEQMLINTVSELKLNLIDEKKNSNGKEKIRKTK